MTSKLSIKRFGLAIATTSALAYAGCVFVMFAVPREGSIRFFNSLMHGIDVEPIMRTDVSLLETTLGIAQTFILGWFFGALIAAIYNIGSVSESDRT